MLPEQMRELRKRAGLTQFEVAEKIGVSSATISNWEQGKVGPSPDQVTSIKRLLGAAEDAETVSDVSPVATWLTNARAALKLSVPRLAELAKVSAPAIYKIESGVTRNLQAATRRKLEAVLGAMPVHIAEEVEEEAAIAGLGSMEDFDPHLDSERPAQAGIYVLYDISERPIYVGEGKSVRKRIRDHEDKFWFKRPIVETASWIQVDDENLRRQIEAILIKFLKSNAVINKQHVSR